MKYFQSVFKHHRMVLAGVILAFVLGLGCSTHQAENMAESASDQEQFADAVPADGIQPMVKAIRVRPDADAIRVEILGTAPLAYTSIKQAFPFGIAIYLPETVLDTGLTPVNAKNPYVSGIKAGYADEKKTTAKVEIFLTKDMPYEVKEKDNALGVIIQKTAAGGEVVSQTITDEAPARFDTPEPETSFPPETEKVEATGGPATLTHIEFDTAPSGRSDIRVTTDHPVKYEARQAGTDRIELVLYNTRIPDIHKRPLLTQYFNSAVEKVQPLSVPGKSKDASIAIKIREQVPYQVVQTSQGIHMAFEPSSVSPPQFDKAKQNMASGSGMKTTGMETTGMETTGGGDSNLPATPSTAQEKLGPEQGQDDGMAMEDIDSLTGAKKRVYKGEKIKLDFFDTDVKNVFRILKSVSGLNFAIDSDVTGKVTLSLEEPVPWDQVLDLILKMNQLGKKREGNVVRIARLATIADEEKQLQEAIQARKESLAQAKTLDPMITEYIPISYANANVIYEQVVPIMSQKRSDEEGGLVIKLGESKFGLRGAISVDERTNMIIITDTQDKIDKAYEIINELDRVTPQIMIEARVVEVTKDFSRSLGMAWNLTNASTSIAGFADDYGVAVNQSSSAGISGEFSFFRLFGSSVNALNAQLEASEETGDSKIISSPRILALDNVKATIKQGYEYAYLEESSSGGTTTKFKDIDLSLEVTPHVTPDKRIAMTVYLTKNDVFSVTSTGVPTLATNEAETQLLVNNNETVVIGGVVKSSRTEDEGGLPFLTGIPILGKLFGISSEEDSRSELLIFLTPSIVQLEQKQRFRKQDAATAGMN